MADVEATPGQIVEEEEPACGSGSPYNGRLNLRIAAIFIILVTSLFGTLLPIVLRRVRRLNVPEFAFSIVKYFGSGVIIATAFIHLLAPSWEALTSPCLTGTWTLYPWTPAITMGSVFVIFLVELTAHRTGSAYLRRRGLRPHDSHLPGANRSSHTTHGLHTQPVTGEVGGLLKSPSKSQVNDSDPETLASSTAAPHAHTHGQDENDHEVDENAMAQILGVCLLEFGVILHSLIIGLTLAVNDEFVTLFIVLIFHQMFEGLGLGSRLSSLPLPRKYRWVPWVAAVLYASITPLGVAIGLGVRNTYNPDSANAVIISGVLDAVAAGVLLYTGLVELLAHDFIFNREMASEASDAKVAFSVLCVLLGAGLMALLGRWA